MATEAPSLKRLKIAIDTRWPGRDRSSDGWIGDAAHQGTRSDHNPDSKGMVHARDIDRDGVHMPTIIASAILHPSTAYFIFNRRIYSAVRSFLPISYDGDNPHTGHGHESIKYTWAAENSAATWEMIATTPQWGIVRRGATGIYARQVQAYLNGHGSALVVDGDFGTKTYNAVVAFQARWGLQVDGEVGPQTTAAFRTK